MQEHPNAVELISPFGERLIDLRLAPEALAEARAHASRLPSVQLSARAVCDLELLAVGAFSPLDRFMGEADFRRVLAEMRLADGRLFPMPITLPLPAESGIALDQEIALRDAKNDILAIMRVEEIFEYDWREVARLALGTEDPAHPMAAELQRTPGRAASGRLQVLGLPRHYDFESLRMTPAETRARLSAFGRRNVVAFQTRNPLHRAHEELTKRAIAQTDGVLLLHPVVGVTKPGDVDHFSRVRTYRALTERHYEPDRVLLSLLPLAMRMAGPREALWHALIRRNYGASHFIVGRDHAGPGNDSTGKPFYGPYDAQQLVERHSEELGIRMIPFSELVYLPDEDRYEEAGRLAPGARTLSLSGTQVRDEYLNRGRLLPAWFTRPEVAEVLAETYPPRHRQGVCIWFTGLSGAGKSTTAEILASLVEEHGRQITLLDGDVVRTHLSKGLGFSQADRDTNIRRIGFVAAEIVRHGGIAICAAISPYRATRDEVRRMVGNDRFIEVFVDTPLDVCEERDVKGLYAQARRGEVKGVTGIDDPYEPPPHPEMTLDTVSVSPEENAARLRALLLEKGFLKQGS